MFEPKVAEICSDTPSMCSDLNPDEWCRAEKADIIKQRYRHPEESDPQQLYALMVYFEDYQRCITKASGLIHKKYRDKEEGRMKGVMTARKELDRLSRKTRDSSDPLLSYYHWSRFSDEAALTRFMAAAKSNQLTSPDLQIALASIQYKSDLTATKATLYRALSLYKDDDHIDTDVFHTLSTIGLEEEKYKVAYIWSKVAQHYDENINELQLNAIATKYNLPIDLMDDVADEITDALSDGKFNAETLGLTKL